MYNLKEGELAGFERCNVYENKFYLNRINWTTVVRLFVHEYILTQFMATRGILTKH